MTTRGEEASVVVDLGNSLDISHVRPIWEKLNEAIEKASSVVLKADQVEVADTPGLQMLSVVFIDIKGQGLDVRWDGVAESVRQAAELLGLTKHLEL